MSYAHTASSGVGASTWCSAVNVLGAQCRPWCVVRSRPRPMWKVSSGVDLPGEGSLWLSLAVNRAFSCRFLGLLLEI